MARQLIMARRFFYAYTSDYDGGKICGLGYFY